MATRKKAKARPQPVKVRPQPSPVLGDAARAAGAAGNAIAGDNAVNGAEERSASREVEEPRHEVRTIIVTERKPRLFDLAVNGRYIDNLAFDETLGVLASLLVPAPVPIRLPLRTADELYDHLVEHGRRMERKERTMQVEAFNSQMQANTANEIEIRRRVEEELARIEQQRKTDAAARAGKASGRARRRTRKSR